MSKRSTVEHAVSNTILKVICPALSTKMKKDNDNDKEKHAKTNEKHARAVVLREKWLEENEGKTREEWNPKEDMLCN